MMPVFVVTGCGRSGTSYMAMLMRRLGHSCGHEDVFNTLTNGGRIDFRGYDGDASWMAVPFLDRLPPGTVVLHQVRAPLPTIRSWVSTGALDRLMIEDNIVKHAGKRILRAKPMGDYGTRIFVKTHAPRVFTEKDVVSRAARYWVEWNRMAEAAKHQDIVYVRYRVEEIDATLLGTILTSIGSRNHDRIRDALATVPKDVNTRARRSSASLDDVSATLRREVISLAVEYGIEPL